MIGHNRQVMGNRLSKLNYAGRAFTFLEESNANGDNLKSAEMMRETALKTKQVGAGNDCRIQTETNY